MEYARLFDSEVHFVRVVNAPMSGEGDRSTPRPEDALTAEAQRYLADVAARTSTPHEARLEVLSGNAADVLGSYIEDNDLDLVVMTSHGRGGLFRSALGSVTDRLLGSAAPVLVVRAGGAE